VSELLSYRATEDGRVLGSRNGGDVEAAQTLTARVTGNDERGNER
jgi:hypothetical protein